MIMQMKLSKKNFKSLLSKHQFALKTSMKGSDFIFDSVNL